MTQAKRPFHRWVSLVAIAAMTTCLGAPMAAARTLEISFMPPVVEPQDLCGAADAPEETTAGEQGLLTDALRLRFIQRDIRMLQTEDAARWFDFIETLIGWRAELDKGFAGTNATLARVALFIDAGRVAELSTLGLIDGIRHGGTQITGAQKVVLANYYLNGIGVAADVDYAHGLLRDAAYGGNAEALLALARMELQGNPVPGWDAPLDMTVTLAFGGILGPMNEQVCGHAERIAQEYISGDIVSPNPEVAFAWYRFAADLGSASAAWRVVEFHLGAKAERKDNDEMLKYLRLAVQRGISLDLEQAKRIQSASDVDEQTLTDILGFNFSTAPAPGVTPLTAYVQLAVNLDGDRPAVTGPLLEYLREVTRFDTAPGWVFTKLALEVLARRGEWAGEAEAMPLLEEAALRRDPEGMEHLARKLIRYRDDPVQMNRAVNLLLESAERFGRAKAMSDLDSLFRCQMNDAPRLTEADLWARNYRATMAATVDIDPNDLIAIDAFGEPEILAQVQSQALAGDATALASFMQLLQRDPTARDEALRYWAGRAGSSDRAIEVFARQEFFLAATPSERDQAIEFMRRAYLNNGVATALDLAVALVEAEGRNPAVAAEIMDLLNKAGARGEGASIRLKARLLRETQDPRLVYEEFAQTIDERGDFLALMFAIPYLPAATADEYLDRAVSVMTCGNKDVAELADSYAYLGRPEASYQWNRVGLTFHGGSVLAKLALTDTQVGMYDKGTAPTEIEVLERVLAEGDRSALRGLFTLTADPDLQSYDPQAAVGHLAALMATGLPEDEDFVRHSFARASPELRTLVNQRIDVMGMYLRAAQRGDIPAKLSLGLLLRDTASSLADLQSSARWLREAAEGGSVTAMAELAQMMTQGIGAPPDRKAALDWAEQAARGGDARSAELARLLRLEQTQ